MMQALLMERLHRRVGGSAYPAAAGMHSAIGSDIAWAAAASGEKGAETNHDDHAAQARRPAGALVLGGGGPGWFGALVF